MKNLKKVTELLEVCQTTPDKYFALKLKENGGRLIGLSQNELNPFSAIIMKKEQHNVTIFGFIDNKLINYSNKQNFNFANEIIIAVDCRKENNYKVYYKLDKSSEDFEKITSHTELKTNDSIVIFWEDLQMSCMTFCNFDKERNENIREVITATNVPMKRFLRGIIREFISPYVIAQSNDENDERSELLHEQKEENW